MNVAFLSRWDLHAFIKVKNPHVTSKTFTITILVTFVISVIGTILVSDYLRGNEEFAEGVNVRWMFSKALFI